jgi:hypothetical protein
VFLPWLPIGTTFNSVVCAGAFFAHYGLAIAFGAPTPFANVIGNDSAGFQPALSIDFTPQYFTNVAGAVSLPVQAWLLAGIWHPLIQWAEAVFTVLFPIEIVSAAIMTFCFNRSFS